MLKQIPVWTVVLAGFVVLAAIYFFAVRPKMQTWGLTQAEIGKALPGDELNPTPRWGFKQAVTIHAPASKIWPWLVQVGYQRAGWYSFDAIEGMMGSADFVDGHSANRIVPELQDLKVGDTIRIAPPIGFTVERLEPNRLLFLHTAVEPKTGKALTPGAPLPADYLNSSWTFYLEPIDAQTTRLYARFVFDAPATLANTMMYGIFMDGGALLMQPKMLSGIQQRAEN